MMLFVAVFCWGSYFYVIFLKSGKVVHFCLFHRFALKVADVRLGKNSFGELRVKTYFFF